MLWFLIPLVLLALLWTLWRAYKRLIGPAYAPASVRRIAQTVSTFDSPDLIAASTPTQWFMPQGITLHHFAVGRSPEHTQAAVPVLCVSGGPGVAVSKPWAVCENHRLRCAGLVFHHFHPRGTGQSSKPIDKFPSKRIFRGVSILEEKLGLAAQVSDLERIRRRICSTSPPSQQKISIIAHSFGAFLATLYAAEFPENVRSLVLIAPANVLCIPPENGDFFQIIRNHLDSEQDKREFDNVKERLLDFQAYPSMDENAAMEVQSDIAKWFFKASPADAPETEEQADSIGGWTAFASYMSFGMYADFRTPLKNALGAVNFPTLIVNGSEDILFPNPASAQEYMTLFPASRIMSRVIRGSHFLQDRSADQLAECIIDTLVL